MNRRPALLALVVVLAALSGCSVLFGDDTSPSGPAAEPTGSPGATSGTASGPSDSTATDVSGTPGSEGTSTPSEGADDRRTFDASSLNAEHRSALEAAGSFTRQSSLVIRNASATRYINGSYAIERDGEAMNVANITDVVGDEVNDLPTTTRYTEGETTYERQVERTGDGTETRYRRASEPYSDDDPQPVNRTVAYSLGQIARAVVDGSSWNRTGTGQLEGADVTRYDASAEHFGVVGFAGAEGGATLAVDEHGVVRYVAYRFVVTVGGEPTEYVYEAGYTDVGSTTVSEPGWTDET
jgi:hypothetical protein